LTVASKLSLYSRPALGGVTKPKMSCMTLRSDLKANTLGDRLTRRDRLSMSGEATITVLE